MPENDNSSIFRKKTLERISAPDQLTDYLRVTNPGTWVVLIIVVLLLLGILAWSMVGTLETRADVKVSVKDHKAQVIALDSNTLSEGMSFSVSGQEYKIAAAEKDEYGRSVGVAEVSLPDGIYDGSAVIERVRPISFLIENK